MLDTVLLKKSESLVRTLREFRVDPRASFRMLEQGMSADPASRLTVSPEAVGRIIESYAKAVEAQEKAAPAYRLGGEWVAIIRREKAEFLDAFRRGTKRV